MISRAANLYKAILQRDTPFWRGSIYGVFVMTAVALVGMSLGMPLGYGIKLDIIIFTFLGLLSVVMGSILIAGMLALCRLPAPRFFVGGMISVYLILSFSLSEFNITYLGAAVITGSLLVIGFLLGSSITLLKGANSNRVIASAYAASSIGLLCFVLFWLLSPGKEVYIHEHKEDLSISQQYALQVDDPSQPGGYEVEYFTYGSGRDHHRDEFAEDVDLITETVDASGFQSNWPMLRELYWGFDETEIPLNGRVWMPQGKGPFPIALVVHGSHKMEQYSDTGYAYLGELLASRGFITVSVDENFINFSIWSNGVDQDMTIRAWILLQHLNMLQQANASESTFFYDKIDMENIALIGHSRGGQAAALAVGFDEFYNDEEDNEVKLDYEFSIKAVAAIAPTDKLLDDKRINLENVDYLTLQGSHDSDVNTFYGDRQYQRTDVTSADYQFKASLYIGGANHGLFNTQWGNKDMTMPTALLLNKGEMISGEEQRQIAKTYISAFLEASLHGKEEYLKMFRDYRTALQWLPETEYINRFEDARFISVDRFGGGLNDAMFSGEWILDSLLEGETKRVKNRYTYNTLNNAMFISWDGQEEGSYTLELKQGFLDRKGIDKHSSFVFSLANLDFEYPNANQGDGVVIEMEDLNGIAVQYPLDHFKSMPPVIHSEFTKHEIFEETIREGYLGESTEPVFQTYEVKLSEFSRQIQDFKPQSLHRVKFIFERGTEGVIMIDDVGFLKGEE